MVLRGDPASGGKIPRRAKLPARANRRNMGVRGQAANAGNRAKPPHRCILFSGRYDLLLKRSDRLPQSFDLRNQHPQCRRESLWNARVICFDARGEFGKIGPSLRRDNAELEKQATNAVHKLGVLLDQQIARPFKPARGLLRDAIDGDKAHVQARKRGANRRRVAGIVLGSRLTNAFT